MSDAPPGPVIEIVVPGEPVAKGRPRMRVGNIRGAQRAMAYTPAKTRRYEGLVELAAQEAMAGAPPLEDALKASIVAFVPIPASWSRKRQGMAELGEIHPAKRPDLDNFVKAGIDGCNGIVFRDDSQIVDLRASKSYSRRPRLEIRVEPI